MIQTFIKMSSITQFVPGKMMTMLYNPFNNIHINNINNKEPPFLIQLERYDTSCSYIIFVDPQNLLPIPVPEDLHVESNSSRIAMKKTLKNEYFMLSFSESYEIVWKDEIILEMEAIRGWNMN